ncbi:structural toxin protein RtxA [Legionella pneumophila]|uniref:enhanced entry virulence factor RtxA n=9 Tax=Legionella pneumophila TaxID=446 RepID=UPI000DFEC4E1|nr:enhanced entry virulence factor RtxA [Legionella pneumophila]STY13236.1 structural toxin protein RtxA [Legionella pneumophila]
MLVESVIGIVRAVNGLLEKVNAQGHASLVKSGARLEEGDVLTLLSGEAYIQFIHGFPEALALGKPVKLDGVSPALQYGVEELNEQLVQEALAKGIDPSVILDVLGSAAAGAEAVGSGGDAFIIDPLFGFGQVTAGYPTGPISFAYEADTQDLFWYVPEETVEVAESDLTTEPESIPQIPQFNSNQATVIVFEDALTGGIRDSAVQVTTARASLSPLISSSSEVASSFAFNTNLSALPTLKSGGIELDYILSSDRLALSASMPDGTNVARFELTADGQLTQILIGAIDHPTSDSDDNEWMRFDLSPVIDVTFTRTSDGTFLESRTLPDNAVVAGIQDDVPIARAQLTNNEILLDETVGVKVGDADAANDDFNPTTTEDPFNNTYGRPIGLVQNANLLDTSTSEMGGDYKNATMTHLLKITDAVSGLQTTDGTSINLFLESNGDITGRAGDIGAPAVFAIRMNPNTGAISVAQYGPIKQFDTNSHDEAVDLTGRISAVVRVTDGDGDVSSAEIPIGQLIIFEDDGPSIDGSKVLSADVLTVDETNLGVNATASFADNFAQAIDFGEDGAGSVSYALVLNGNNVGSGLYAIDNLDVSTADGDGIGRGGEIVLNQNGNVVTGSLNGTDYFTITIDAASGTVTFDQLASVWHANTANPDDQSALQALANSLVVRATVVDADGDKAAYDLDVSQGVFQVKDDGPSIDGSKVLSADVLTVDETNLGVNATASFADNFAQAIDFGEDGAGSVSYALVLNGNNVGSGLYAIDNLDVSTADGDGIGRGGEIVLNQNGNVVTGSLNGTDYFTITIDAASGTVTFDQLASVWHANTANPDDQSALQGLANSLVVRATVVDADGDKAAYDLDVSQGVFQVKDDGPSIDGSKVLSADVLAVDETNLGVNATASFADNFAQAIDFGEDGAGSVSYALVLNGNNVGSGLYAIDNLDVSTADGDGIGRGGEIVLNQNGNVVTGSLNGTDYFTITIDAASGTVTFDQLASVWHANTANPDDQSALQALANSLVVRATVVDADGDKAAYDLDVSQGVFQVKDDGPSIDGSKVLSADVLTVDETNLGVNATASFADNFAQAIDFGEDGAGSVSYALVLNGNNVGSGLYAIDNLDVSTADGDGIGRGGEIVLNQNGNVVTGSLNGTDYFTITIDAASGTVTFDQLASVWHANTANPDDQSALQALANSLVVRATVVDADGDKAAYDLDVSQGVFQVKDDGPSIDGSKVLSADVLTVDETNLGVNATASFADNFAQAIDFGEDGAGSVSYALVLNGNNVGSGLYAIDNLDVSTADGDGIGRGGEIVLNQNGNVVTGSLNGTDYFTITIDAASGTVTFDQLASVWHANTANPDDQSALQALANSLVVRATVVDADGDKAAYDLDVSQGVFQVKDDGPSIDGSKVLSADVLTVDETNLGVNATASFADNFAQAIDFGEDGAGSVSYALVLNGNNVGSGLYAIDNLDVSTADGDGIGRGGEIVLNQNGNVVTGSLNGTDYFTITIDAASGTVTFDQLASVWHANTANPDDQSALQALANSLVVRATVVDADGDKAAYDLDVSQGVFQVKDDGPSIDGSKVLSADVLTVDETNLGVNATASFADNFAQAIDFGEDGAGSVSYALVLNGNNVGSGLYAIDNLDVSTADGDGIGRGGEIVLNQNGNVVTGSLNGTDYFTITIDAASGTVTFDQLASVWHANTANPDDQSALQALANSLVVRATVVDADGDKAAYDLDVSQGVFQVKDDGPSIDGSKVLSADVLTVDETNLGVNATASFADNFAQAIDFGEDGAGSVSYALVLNGNNVGSGLYAIDNLDVSTADGDGIGRGGEIVLNQNGNVVTGSLNGTDYFTITIDAASGTVTFDQLASVWHANTANPDDQSALQALANSLVVRATVVDADGDKAAYDLDVSQGVFQVKDDGPSIDGSKVLSADVLAVDETNLGVNATASFADNFAQAIDFGEDGAGSVSYALVLNGNNVGSGLYAIDNLDVSTADGDGIGRGGEIVLNQNGNVVTGSLNGTDYFTITIDAASGTVTFDQLASVWHANTANPDDQSALQALANSLVVRATVVDADGDKAAYDLDVSQGVFQVKDDGPSIDGSKVLSADVLTVDETNLGVNATASFADNFAQAIDFGEDGAGSVSYALVLNGNNVGSGLYAIDNLDVSTADGDGIGRGGEIVLNQNGNVVTGSLNGTDYFTITIDAASGTVTFDQLASVWHANTANPDDQSALQALANSLVVRATVVDADGDKAAYDLDVSQGVFQVKDDGPSIDGSKVLSADVLTVDETNLGVNATASFADNFAQAIDFGEDGAGSVSYALVLNGNNVGSGLYAIDNLDVSTADGDGIGRGGEIVLNQNGNVVTGSLNGTDYFTITIDAASGTVTFDQLASVWHANTANPDDQSALQALANSLVVRATVVDADGDKAAYDLDVSQGVFQVKDDGPSIDGSKVLSADVLTVDETNLGVNATASFADNFAQAIDFGEDGAGSVSYALVLNGNNVGSGLYAIDNLDVSTADGDGIGRGGEIVLNQNGNVVTGSLNGTDYFTITIDAASGTVTFDQLASVWHANTANPDDQSALQALANSLVVRATVVDADGDKAAYDLDVSQGVFQVKDDGPSIDGSKVLSADVLTVDETNLGVNATASFADNFAQAIDFGEDGAGSVSYALVLNGNNVGSGLYAIDNLDVSTADGDGIGRGGEIVLNQNGNVVTGSLNGTDYFTITIDAASGTVTFDQLASVWHANTANPDDQSALQALANSLVVRATVVDADGDKAAYDLDVSQGVFQVKDDGPSIDGSKVLSADVLTVDETNLGVNATASFADNFAQAIDFGEDGAGSVSYALVLNGNNVGSGLYAIDNLDVSTADGDGIGRGGEIVLNQNGNVVTGSLNGTDYFTITIDAASGTVTFDQLASVWHANTANPDDQSALQALANSLVVRATVVDADGDKAAYDLDVSQGVFQVKDDGPSIDGSKVLSADVLAVDETNLGVNATASFADNFAQAIDFGEDGAGSVSYALVLNGNNVGSGLYAIDNLDVSTADGDGIGRGGEIVLNQNGNVVTGSLNGTDYFTITIDAASGTVTFDQLASVWHANTANPDDQSALQALANSLVVRATVVDADGDKAAYDLDVSQGVFQVKDDGPSIDGSKVLSADVLTVDETNLGVNATASFADNFAQAIDFGEDGAGSVSYALVLNGNNVGSGLYAIDNLDVSTADGDGIGRGGEIVLNQNGNVVTGSLNGTDYFTITIDAASGTVTFDQLASVWHANTANPDDQSALQALANSLVVRATVVDADGDKAAYDLDVSQGVFQVKDDGPSIDGSKVLSADVLTVDETNLGVNATASFADNFAQAIDFGEDGAGSVSYALVLNGNNVGSGLYAIDNLDVSTADGDGIGRGGEIVLNQNGNVVTGSLNGTDYFTITIDAASGTVTFDQLASVWHANTANPDDQSALQALANSLVVRATVVDADGDKAAYDLDVSQGVFQVKDDGPSIDGSKVLSADVLTVDETNLGVNATASFADNFAQAIDFGEDGAGSVSYALVLNGNNVGSGLYAIDNLDVSTADGDGIGRGGEIVLNQNGNVVTGSLNGTDYFTITIDAASGTVTFDQLASVWHANTANPDDQSALQALANSLVVRATVVDADGDKAAYDLDVSQGVFQVKDDGPSIDGSKVLSADVLTVDETNLGVNATASFADNFAQAIDFGEDGAGSVSYALVLNGNNVGSGLYAIDNLDVSTADGDGIGRGGEIVLNQNGNVVTGSLNGTDYFTITIDAASGTVTFDQLASVWHANTANPDDQSALQALANSLVVRATVVDADGDKAAYDLDVSQGVFQVKDDGPSIDGSKVLSADVLTVDETNLGVNATASFADNFAQAIDFGEDGAGSVSYALVLNGNNVGSGLYAIDNLDVSTADGDGIGRGGEIVLNQNGNVVTGSLNGTDYFTITIDAASGTVTFDQLASVWHANTANPDDQSALQALANSLVVRATVVDADGDKAAYDLDVSQGVFQVKDDGPSIDGSKVLSADVLTVDETNLGVNATASFADNFAQAIDFGEDGAGSVSYALVLNGNNVGSGLYAIDNLDVSTADGDGIGRGGEIVLNQNGNVVTGSLNGTDYFTITIDAASGTVTFDQLASVWHANTANPDDQSALQALANSLVVRATVVDADGDKAAYDLDVSQGVFQVKDDGPSIDGSKVLSADVLTVDETNLGVNATASFADNFAQAIDFGEDGAGSVSYALVLNGNNVGSGLYAIDNLDVSTADGDGIGRGGEIVLNQNGNVVTGSLNGTDYFTITIDAASGTVTFDQLASVWHANTANPDDQSALQALANSLVVRATVVDADGDKAAYDLDVSQGVFQVKDDGPSIDGSKVLSADVLTVDETNLGVNATASFADNFAQAIDFGEDGAGSVSYALVLNGNNVGSGLYAIDNLDVSTADGDGIGRGGEIVLNQNGNVVTGSLNGTDYFTITIDAASGTVTFDQLASVWHANTANPDDQSALQALANSLVVRATVVDADGDKAAYDLDVSQGVFQVKDDGPSIDGSKVLSADVLTVDETNLGVNATASFADNFAQAIDFGEDGAGSVSYALVLNGNNVGSGLYAIDNLDVSTADGDGIGRGGEIVLNQNGNVVTGSLNGTDYFTITIDAASGTVTFDQLASVWHANTANPDDQSALQALANSLVVRATVVDADGDKAAYDLDVSQGVFQVKDDGPSVSATKLTGVVDEDGLTGGIAGGVGDVAGQAVAASGNVATLFQSGADAPLTYSLNANTSGLPALSSGGVALTYAVSGDTLTASAGSTQVFTFTLNANGNYSFTLLAKLDHPAGADENDIAINLGSVIRATDSDGDTVTAAADGLVITVDDDTPIASANKLTGVVDEDGLTGGIAGGVGDVAGQAVAASGNVATLFQSGADAPLTYSLNTNTSGLPALSSGGVALTYAVSGDTLTASAGSTQVFTFTLNANGNYSFTLLAKLDHLAGADENDIAINLGSVIRATDSDGDTVTAAADGLVITVDDDTPIASANKLTGVVDEDGLTGGIAGGVGDVAGQAVAASGNVATLFQSGADAPLTYSLNANTSGLPALSSGGVALTYAVSGDTLTASAGSTQVFTFTLNANGNYSFTLLAKLDHPAGADENDITINLGSVIRATDSDGDTVTAAADGLVITVDDDTPVTGTISLVADEDNLPRGNNDTASGDAAQSNLTGTLPVNFGADGAGSIDFQGMHGLSAVIGNDNITYNWNASTNTLTAYRTGGALGVNDVFKIVVNPTTGQYTFTLLAAINHHTVADNTEGLVDPFVNLNYRVIDGDGDTAIGTLKVTIDDDIPKAITPEEGFVTNQAGIVRTFDLDFDANIDNNVGADQLGTITFFGITNGQVVTGTVDGVPNQTLTSGGSAIHYYVSGNNVVEGWINGGPGDVGSTIVFRTTLQPDMNYNASNDTYKFELFQPISTSTNVSIANFSGVNATSREFIYLENASGPGEDILFSAYIRNDNGSFTDATVNANAQGIGVNNQNMNDRENLRLDFVRNASTTGTNQNMTYEYDDHYLVNNFSFKIIQVTGNPLTGSLEVWVRAYNADDDDPTNNTVSSANNLAHQDALRDDPQVALTQILVNGVPVTPTAVNASGGYLISGLNLNDTITIRSANGYDRVEIENPRSGAHGVSNSSLNNETFDIGLFSYDTIKTTPSEININMGLSLTDSDGDKINSSIDINLAPSVFKVGENVDDTSNSNIPHRVGGDTGVVDGSAGADILVGDVGGVEVIGTTARLAFILDESGSMSQNFGGTTRLEVLKQAMTDILTELSNTPNASITVHLVKFASVVNGTGTFEITGGGLQQALDFISGLQIQQGLLAGTNYEAALGQTVQWFSSQSGTVDVQQTLFFTDGVPTFYMDGNSTEYTNLAHVYGNGSQTEEVLWENLFGEHAGGQATSDRINNLTEFDPRDLDGLQSYSVDTNGDGIFETQSVNSRSSGTTQTTNDLVRSVADTFNEVQALQAYGPLRAVSIADNANVYLQEIDSTGQPYLADSPEVLQDILDELNPFNVLLAAGSDTIQANQEDDLIFGDVLFTDKLAEDEGLDLPKGSGWAVFEELEANHGWSRQDTLDYIRNHADELGRETVLSSGSKRSGGHDIISGGQGDDRIYGQEGNDVIDAGSGDDVIVGGTGNDTLTGGSGADQFVFFRGHGSNNAGTAPTDIITDFEVNIDKIVINANNIIGVSVSNPVSNPDLSKTYTITVNYSDAPSIEHFKVTLSNGALLNDSGKTHLNGVVISGGTATIDGTIVGAVLYLDLNANNQEDEGERLGITDQYGHVEWVVDLSKFDVNGDGQYVIGEARAVQTGGFDIDTGLSYEINLYGPVGSAVISPLTSLLQAQLEAGMDYETANSALVACLGLPEGTQIISFNPITGSGEVLAQNAGVMTAAIQFSEIAAIHYSTDEGHVSFAVFEAISKALLELPEGVVADFSDVGFLQSISNYLGLDALVTSHMIDYMAASQKALEASILTLTPGEDALTAISKIQHVTQGIYAQAIEMALIGYLPLDALKNMSVVLKAYADGDITAEQLNSFEDKLSAVIANWKDNNVMDISRQAALQTEHTVDDSSVKSEVNHEMAQEVNAVINDFMDEHNISLYYYDQQAQMPQEAQEQQPTEHQAEETVMHDDVVQDLLLDDHSLTMLANNPQLNGGNGNDVLHGTTGNDFIRGGQGNDTMTGGGGVDTFFWLSGDDDGGVDTITDFKANPVDQSSDASVLNLSDLLSDADLETNSLDNYLNVSTTEEGDTAIKVDPNGNGNFDAPAQTIILEDVDLTAVFATNNSHDIVNQMIANGNLIVEQ